MTVRIKELVIRYEDDGEVSPLNAQELAEKYKPLNLVIHHHCAPPPMSGATKPGSSNLPEETKREFKIDLSKLDQA